MAKKKLPHTEEHYLQKLGERLKQLRIEAGYSNYENFAFDKGLSRSHYGKQEQGRNITFASLIKILKAHDIDFKEFFAEGFE